MGVYKENPRYKCVTTRLNDDEWEELSLICDQSSKSMSQFIREALSALLIKGTADKKQLTDPVCQDA